MAYTTINKSGDYFNTVLYTGDGNDGRAVTGVGFQPDFCWFKSRSAAGNYHDVYDAIRGATKRIYPNDTSAEQTVSAGLQSFTSDGFTLGDNSDVNQNSVTYASWNWKAGTGQGSSNTDGSINTTYTSVNTTAGFSISTYTGTGSNATVGHGLGVAPKMIIIKSTSNTKDWTVYHAGIGNTKWLELNATTAEQSSSNRWNNTSPTSSVFTVATDSSVNGSGYTYVAYCFAEKTGYSKFGSYVGNNSADGNFVYLGFKPAFVIAKNSTSSGFSWELFDNKRNATDGVGNVIQKRLFPDSTAAEGSNSDGYLDFVSNGFKIRRAGDSNENGSTYIYMAFAAAPLVGTNNVPCTAR